jgi:hypothetical protein
MQRGLNVALIVIYLLLKVYSVKNKLIWLKVIVRPCRVAQFCNPSYLGGGDWEDGVSRQAPANC